MRIMNSIPTTSRILCLALCLLIPTIVNAAPPSKATTSPHAGNILAPKAFRSAVKKVLPSLVTIETFGGVTSGGLRAQGIKRPGEGPTTGLILTSDGYVITSTFNFIKKPPVITVILRDGKRHVAKLLGRDETRKICLLKIAGVKDLPTAKIAPLKNLRVGQWSISVGFGFGDAEPAVSTGIVSATNRISGRAVQTDANTSPANYGGPLIDIEGRVIGICVPLHPQSSAAGSGVQWYDSGIGFAVPLDGNETLFTAMKAGKTIRPALLGVQIAPGGEGAGVAIAAVQAGSAAQKAGLKPQDVILSVDGKVLTDAAHLKSILGQHLEGDQIKLLLRRGKKELEVEVVFTPSEKK